MRNKKGDLKENPKNRFSTTKSRNLEDLVDRVGAKLTAFVFDLFENGKIDEETFLRIGKATLSLLSSEKIKNRKDLSKAIAEIKTAFFELSNFSIIE